MLIPHLLLALCAPLPQSGPQGDAHLEDATLANVVHVRTPTTKGTAFLLRYRERRYLVTARHVVAPSLDEPGTPLEFLVGRTRRRAVRAPRLLHADTRSDLAIFTFEEDSADPCFPEGAGLVPHADMHLASQVFLVGYPASLIQTYGSAELRVVGGWIAGLKKYVPGSTVEYVDIDMPGIEHGHSGGPILMLQKRVVAVAVQRRPGSISRGIAATYAVPVKYVTALIDGRAVVEDRAALDEVLRGTSLVIGLSAHGKRDADIWAQRIERVSGEVVWGEFGIYVGFSTATEAHFVTVPSVDGSAIIVHEVLLEESGNIDLYAQRLSRYGELLLESGIRGAPVLRGPRRQQRPAACTDGSGGAIVVCEVAGENGAHQVCAQRLAADGRCSWTRDGRPVSADSQSARRPALVSDDAGGAIVVYESAGADSDTQIMAQRIDPDGRARWRAGAQAVAIANSPRPERRPMVVADGAGGALVLYEVEVQPERRALFAQRISRAGELMWNAGKSGVLVLPYHVSGVRESVALLADGTGGAFVAAEVYRDHDAVRSTDIAVQRLGAAGELCWGRRGTGELQIPTMAASARAPERRPRLAHDARGGIVVAFELESAPGDVDVMAQRVAPAGELSWNGGARSSPVGFSRLPEHTPQLISADDGRVLILFEIERGDGLNSIACQALAIDTGNPAYGGKMPVLVMSSRGSGVNYHLENAIF